MKKTIFILTLLLPFGFLFAQSWESEVEQTGVNNSVVVTQDGLLNYSWVNTYGDDNTPSFVNQEGNGVNNSYVDQAFIGPVDGNTANVTQVNHFLLSGDDNESDINQMGDYNAATVTQIATMSIHGVARNSTINQSGDWNTATVYQEGRMIDATINQNGDENTSNVLQEGNKLVANINQPGWANFAEVEQEGYRETADIDQSGAWSDAKIYQGKAKYVSAGTESRLNDAIINQTGFSWGSLAEQTQDGKQNYANIEQNASDFGRAIQIQVNVKTHNVNVGTIGNDVNDAMIYQSNGSNNEAYQLQHFSEMGAPNIADAWQDGNDNYSLETQYGGGNSSIVTQIGDENSSDVTQNHHSIPPPSFGPLPTGF